MSLEAAASTQSDFLIPGLSYTLGQTALYIMLGTSAPQWL
jgi:hypothetical protein